MSGCVFQPAAPDRIDDRVEAGITDTTPDLRQPADLAPALDLSWPPDLSIAPDLVVGRWYQANFENCPAFCLARGLASASAPDGGSCMSGEVRPASGIAAGIRFTWGCWGPCLPEPPHTASSAGGYCYKPNQSRDNDLTDRTVGCFCI